MDLSSNFKALALYNQRMNKQLLKVCKELSYDQLHQETHSFFPTVAAHWNHILFGDLIMLQRLVANNFVVIEHSVLEKLPTAKSVNDTFSSTISEIQIIRNVVDSLYLKITETFTSADFIKIVKYTTTEGYVIERTVGEFLQHIFNHQTHHRGQLTCILSQFGLDYGCTDLPVIVPESM